MADDLNELLDALYSAPPAEFVATRNGAVKALKADGRKEDAADFKALKKPSTAAWVVNQLHFRHSAELEALVEANEALRTAHETPDANIQEVMERRRSALDKLLETAKDILENGGFNPTREQMRRVNRTLEAATTLGSEHELGRLVHDLEPPGFGALSGLAFTANTVSKPARGKTPAKAKSPSKARETGEPRTKSKPSAEPRSSSKSKRPSNTKAKKKAQVASDKGADEKAAQKWAAEARLKVEEKKLERAERQATLAETAHLAAGRYIERASGKIDDLTERLAQANDVLDQAKADALTKREYLDDAREALQRAKKRAQEAEEAVHLARG